VVAWFFHLFLLLIFVLCDCFFDIDDWTGFFKIEKVLEGELDLGLWMTIGLMVGRSERV
jgi:hypothetical protein